MKRCSVAILLVIFVLFGCMLGGCSVDLQPFKTRTVPMLQSATWKVYVCGCVQNEGYVEVCEGTDLSMLLEAAGLLPQTAIPTIPWMVITPEFTQFSVQYRDGSAVRSCANVNGDLSAFDFPANVVQKIEQHIALHGKITNRKQLEEILGDDYADNFYKFFVKESDYDEKID